MMYKTCLVAVALVMVFGMLLPAQEITSIAEINTVDEEGSPTFPGLQTTERYTIEGVALNDAGAFNGLRPDGAVDSSFILFVQDDTGGIQVYSGAWYGGGLSNYPEVKQGDRIRVTGMTGHFGGKTNINERHNPDQRFEFSILGSGGDPAPRVIEDLASATQFDATRQTGGEYYQGRLVELRHVEIVDGTWENGGTLTVQDARGGQITVELRYAARIADNPMPTGVLNIVGVFNQEDAEPPFTDNYLVWPRSIDDFSATSDVRNWEAYE